MRSKTGWSQTLISILSLICGLLSPSIHAEEAPKKYGTAMVFPGGQVATAVFLGMYEAAIEAGKKPDVLLATCGGTIGAAIAASVSSTAEMKRLLQSKAFFDVLNTITLTPTTELQGLLKLVHSIKKSVAGRDRGFEKYFVLDVPQNFGASFIKRDFSAQSPIVMIASKIDGDHFKETYFTDDQTARLLKGLRSPVSSLSHGIIDPETEVRTDVDVLSALRASISDPYLMAPAQVGSDRYLGGVADLYSIETAQALADHVVMSYSVEPDHLISSPAIRNVFGFNVYSRLRQVHQEHADYWVDLSDLDKVVAQAGFGPSLHLFHFFRNLLAGIFTHPQHIDTEMLSSGIPSNYEAYVKKVDFLWNYGKARMNEAYSRAGTLSYIRHAEKFNTSPELLDEISQEKIDSL